MIYNRNGLLIITRVIILTAFISLSVITHYETDFIITPMMFGILAVISIAELIWHLQGLQRSMSRFLLSIKHHDFSRHYPKKPRYKEMHEAYELITQSFEKLETQKHADYRLLQTVSEHLQIGLVCYRPNGDIMFANKTMMNMLGLMSFRKLTSLKPTYGIIYQHLNREKNASNILVMGHREKQLLLKVESFTLQGLEYRLASFYDIKSALETNELESYQKLMKVMTHEIMNSTTPILSLIQVVNKKLILDHSLRILPDKDQRNIATSLRAIETQTEGVLKFVTGYRKINQQITPNLELTNIEELLSSAITLIIDDSSTNFAWTNQIEQMILIDKGLISQTLINLLKNAQEAVQGVEYPRISLTAQKIEAQLSIVVEDNGQGIAPENLSKVFVPFFSTKSDGSGIGLALSRKIVNAHGGHLSCLRTPENTTQFKILLPEKIFAKTASAV